MRYTHSLPTVPSFEGKGLFGYTFGPLQRKGVDVYYVVVDGGHDTFMVSRKITRVYYVLEGDGYFTIDGRKYGASAGMLVEVPPKVEYSYSGRMKLVVFASPAWSARNDTHTRWNHDAIGHESSAPLPNVSRWDGLLGLRVLGKSPIGAFLRMNRLAWNNLPVSVTSLAPLRRYGEFSHRVARAHDRRGQAFSTYFLRNRPALELIRRLVDRRTRKDTLRVAVLGCSTGAEAYSVAWRIKTARPDVKLVLHAMDISSEAVEIGRRGAYSVMDSELMDSNILERMSCAEIQEMFDRDGDVVSVKSWIRERIEWRVGDAGKVRERDLGGPQDVVVASNFLCHMPPPMAERYLRNIARLVCPGGYLFVSGIDLDIRTRVADDLGWRPVLELLEEIHNGDPCMGTFWPWHYAGLEPLNKKRQDWKRRYAAAFQLPAGDNNSGDTVNLDASPKIAAAAEGARLCDEQLR
jgi:SAM-dependent methyltransferase/mannose-6-phosphate isomerase-like protein (cupin superfamily)